MARQRLEYIQEWCRANPTKMAEYQRTYRTKIPGMSLYRTAKERAKHKNLPFTIEFTDLVFPPTCPILGFPLVSFSGNVEKKSGGRWNSPSIDRIIPELGYVKGNVQVISHLANMMKSSATPEQLLKFSNWIQNTYG